jgi:hypothetical protein
MSILIAFASWFLISVVVGSFAGTIIRQNSTPLDEDDFNS